MQWKHQVCIKGGKPKRNQRCTAAVLLNAGVSDLGNTKAFRGLQGSPQKSELVLKSFLHWGTEFEIYYRIAFCQTRNQVAEDITNANDMPGYVSKSVAHRSLRQAILPLCWALRRVYPEACVRFRVQDMHWQTGASPAKGYQDSRGLQHTA